MSTPLTDQEREALTCDCAGNVGPEFCPFHADRLDLWMAPPVRDSRDAAAEWLRSLAPAGTPTLAEAAVYARANNLDHPATLARIDASVRLLNLDLTGEA